MTTNSSAAGNLYQARMGPNSNTKTPETPKLDAQTSSNSFEKRGDATLCPHAPVPTILRPVAGIKFEMSSFCTYNCKISQFKHLLCYLCFIVNKILLFVKYCKIVCSFGSVVEHCISSANGCEFNSQGTRILIKKCIAWMHCKSLWIKVT